MKISACVSLVLIAASSFASISFAQDTEYVDMECSVSFKGEVDKRVVSFRKVETLAHGYGTSWDSSSPMSAGVQFKKSWRGDEFEVTLSILDNWARHRNENRVKGISVLRVKSLSDLPNNFQLIASQKELFSEEDAKEAAVLSCSKH